MSKIARETRHELIARSWNGVNQCDYVKNAAGGGLIACQGKAEHPDEPHRSYPGTQAAPRARWRRLALPPGGWGQPGRANRTVRAHAAREAAAS